MPVSEPDSDNRDWTNVRYDPAFPIGPDHDRCATCGGTYWHREGCPNRAEEYVRFSAVIDHLRARAAERNEGDVGKPVIEDACVDLRESLDDAFTEVERLRADLHTLSIAVVDVLRPDTEAARIAREHAS